MQLRILIQFLIIFPDPDLDPELDPDLGHDPVPLSDPDVFPEPDISHYSVLAPGTSPEIGIDPLL